MYINRHNAFCRFYSATHSRAWNSNFGNFVALTASIHSESSDSGPDEAEFDEEEVLQYNFNRGFNYQEILLFLSERHEHPLSYSTLLRRLKKYGLERRGVTDKEFNDIFCKVQRHMAEQINGPWSSVGYRTIWHILEILLMNRRASPWSQSNRRFLAREWVAE